MDFRACEGSNIVVTSVISVCVCKVVRIVKYACNTHPLSVYCGEVDDGSEVMREGGRKDVLVICYKN